MATATKLGPNVLVCGTPGTGKSTLCEAIGEKAGLRVVDIGKVIREKGFHAGRDEAFDALVLDEASEDKLLDELEPSMAAGGNVVEFHSVDFFPERWFDLVLVLRTDNTTLFDRLTARGYSTRKVEENVTAEIMCVVAEEARECYAEDVVHEVPSNSHADMESNVERVVAWVAQWCADNGVPVPAAASSSSSSSAAR